MIFNSLSVMEDTVLSEYSDFLQFEMRWKELQSYYILPLLISLLVANLKFRFSLLQLHVIIPFAQGQSNDVRLEAGWCAESLASVPVICCFDSKLITVAFARRGVLLQLWRVQKESETCMLFDVQYGTGT